MDYIAGARRIIELEVEELQRLIARIDQPFCEAIEAIRGALAVDRKIVIVGVGKSGIIGTKLAATFNSTGATAVMLGSQDALHGDLGVVNNGDVILVFSYSGETEEITRILPHLRRFDGVLIAITGRADSLLARHGDIFLDVNVEREACPLNLAPTSSSTVMLVLADALAMVLLEARGFQEEDFARLHPGGTLGRSLLLKVSEIMRGAESIAIVDLSTTVTDALSAMISVNGGAAVVVNADGLLEGIFTQGDFVRSFQKNPAIAAHFVSSHMTANPVAITADKLAVEVLRLFNQHPIDDLVVLDEEGRPVGMVDTQDLSRLNLV